MDTSRYALCFVFFAAVGTAVSQTTLQYDIFEEEQVPMTIVDLFRASGLRDQHTTEEVASMSLEIAAHERNYDDFFSITSTGMLQVANRLDRDAICPNERTCQINLDIQVQPYEFFEIIKVELSIMDKNDNAPSFGDSTEFVLSITEGPASDIPRGLPQATDPDSPVNSIAQYELSGQQNDFRLETFTANDGATEPLLRVLVTLDRETTPRYTLILSASDGGAPAQTGSVTIIVDVTDANDVYPLFERQLYEETIDEDAAVGAYVIAVVASDGDIGENADVTYSFATQTEQHARDAFAIDAASGTCGDNYCNFAHSLQILVL